MFVTPSRPKGKLIARAVHPNCGVEAEYRRRLTKLLDEMNASLVYWIAAAYRANEPAVAVLAHDRSPAAAIQIVIRRMRAQWTKRFNEIAPFMADWFATTAATRSDAAMKAALKRGGMTVAFKPSAAVRDSIAANVAENVSLIKSIPAQYLTAVEGHVMRSVQAGRDLGPLVKELRETYGVSKRRAAFIARDQNNKASASMTRVRQLELGVTEAIWVHSRAGREPRPEHVAASGKRYPVAKGMFLEGVWTWPGVQPNCRCVSRPVIPGLP